MRICCVNCCLLSSGLKALGHEVLDLYPKGGFYDLPTALGGFAPQLLVQQESLGPRTLLLGLEGLDCPTAFWSIDGHLNLAWHRHYGRLFDTVLTSQRFLVPAFLDAGCHAAWLPWAGRALPWQQWSQRPVALGFVGRLGAGRPLRQNLVDLLLRPRGVEFRDDLAYQELPRWYGQVRIAPNEAILGEINFRLFETAAAGCTVVTPRVDGLDELFDVGREVLAYEDGHELAAQLDWLAVHPSAAETMGRAARLRVLRSHLPEHRAATLLAAVGGGGRAQGSEFRRAMVLTMAELFRDGRLAASPARLLAELDNLPATDEPLSMGLRLLAENGRGDAALERVAALVAAGNRQPQVLAAGSLTALGAGRDELARHLLALHGQAAGRSPAVQTATQLLHCWSRELARLGLAMWPGFPFDARRHLPATAVECLVAALEREPGNLETMRLLDALLAGRPGCEGTRLGLLSRLSLERPSDWRTLARLGLVNLRAFRVEAGLADLEHALGLAGAEALRFWRLVAAEGGGALAARLNPETVC